MGRQKSATSFIALPLSDITRAEIEAFQSRLKKLGLPVSWEIPDKLHIALYFLGRTDDSTIHDLSLDLKNILRPQNPLNLQITHLDYFYKKHEDSIVYLALSPKDILKELEKTTRPILIKHGFSPPQRYHPYIAIGHLPRQSHPNQTKEALSALLNKPSPVFSPFTIDTLAVFQTSFWKEESTSLYRRKATIPIGTYFT